MGRENRVVAVVCSACWLLACAEDASPAAFETLLDPPEELPGVEREARRSSVAPAQDVAECSGARESKLVDLDVPGASLSVSPTGRAAVIPAHVDGAIRLIDLEAGRVHRPVLPERTFLEAFTRDEQVAVFSRSSWTGDSVYEVDVSTGVVTERKGLRTGPYPVTGDVLRAHDAEGRLWLYSLVSRQWWSIPGSEQPNFAALGLWMNSPSKTGGSWVLADAFTGERWELEAVARIELFGPRPLAVYADQEGRVFAWTPQSGSLPLSAPSYSADVRYRFDQQLWASWDRQRRTALISVYGDGSLWKVDPEAGQVEYWGRPVDVRFPGHQVDAGSVFLAFRSDDLCRFVRKDRSTGSENVVATIAGARTECRSIPSEDGSRLLTISRALRTDPVQVRFWNADSGAELSLGDDLASVRNATYVEGMLKVDLDDGGFRLHALASGERLHEEARALSNFFGSGGVFYAGFGRPARMEALQLPGRSIVLGEDAETACASEKGTGVTRNQSSAPEFVVWKPGQRFVRRYATGRIGVDHCDRARGLIALRSGITGEGRGRWRGRLVFADLHRRCKVTSLEDVRSVRAIADGSYIVGTDREIWKVTPRASAGPSN